MESRVSMRWWKTWEPERAFATVWLTALGDRAQSCTPSGCKVYSAKAHSNPTLIGRYMGEVLGSGNFSTSEEGRWVASESLRMWIQKAGGYVFDSGWHHDASGS